MSTTGNRGTGAADPLILKGNGRDATAGTVGRQKDKIYVAGVIQAGAPDFDGTSNVKIHFHIEY